MHLCARTRDRVRARGRGDFGAAGLSARATRRVRARRRASSRARARASRALRQCRIAATRRTMCIESGARRHAVRARFGPPHRSRAGLRGTGSEPRRALRRHRESRHGILDAPHSRSFAASRPNPRRVDARASRAFWHATIIAPLTTSARTPTRTHAAPAPRSHRARIVSGSTPIDLHHATYAPGAISRRLDLAAAAPEHVRVASPASRLARGARRSPPCARARAAFSVPCATAMMFTLRELRPALAPVRVREDVVASHLASRLDLAARRHAPVEERVVARHARRRRATASRARGRSRSVRSRRARSSAARHAQEFVERHAGFGGARAPRIGADLVDRELALERLEHAPIELATARRCSCPSRAPARRTRCPAPSPSAARGRRRARRAASPA